jgi:hypothetical protein
MKNRSKRREDFNDEDDEDDEDAGYPEHMERKKSKVSFPRHRIDRDTFDFLRDDPQTMMYGRRIALLLMRYRWYYPRLGHVNNHKEDDDDSASDSTPTHESPPLPGRGSGDLNNSNTHFTNATHAGAQAASLAKAWAYFEHVTLPRYVDYRDQGKVKKSLCVRMYRRLMKWDQRLPRADPGESHKPTSLYSPLFTPIAQMGDFGLGTGLYFTTLRAMAILLFVLGVINIPNMMYFAGAEYSDNQVGVSHILKGSAICTRTKWVPCPDCTIPTMEPNRLATATYEENGQRETLLFALKNDCDGATFRTARINFATLIFLVIGIVALKFYQKQWEVKFDEDEVTARDYSIVIENPPIEARDPDQWRRFFERTFRAKVASVTIGIDNDLLIKTLVERREALRCLELALDPGSQLDVLTLARISSRIENRRNVIQKFMAWVFPGIPEYFGRLTVLTARVQGLAQQEYGVKNVFVTFAKETSKNRILDQFSIGDWVIRRNDVEHMNNTGRGKLCFEGKVILKCRHPDEPLTIRWKDLNSRGDVRLIQMMVTNVIAAVGMCVFAGLITVAYEKDPAAGPITISVSNLVFPEFAKWLTEFEAHFSEGDKQTSLYFKIALFRWINTAILITIM